MRVLDPVCGMCIEWEEACAFEVVDERVVYFCCRGCADRFRQAPEEHLERRVRTRDQASCPPAPRPIPITSHGVPTTVPVASLPTVGTLRVDDFAEVLQRAWIGDGAAKRACRVLARALLSQVMGWAEAHRITVRIAAEISLLRHQCDDLDTIQDLLARLPEAMAVASREADLPRRDTRRLHSAMAEQVADTRSWLASWHADPTDRPHEGAQPAHEPGDCCGSRSEREAG